MKKVLLPIVLLVLALGIIPVFLMSAYGQSAASVWTDKDDYAPKETVIISGSGFDANIDLLVRVTRPDGSVITGDGSGTPGSDVVVTDGAGGFTYNYILDGILGLYTVDVLQGDVILATTTFTDSNHLTAVVVGAQTGTLTSGTAGSATYTISFTSNGSGPDLATLSIQSTTWPTGVAASFSPNPVDVTSTSTLTITTTAATPAGVTTFTVQAVADATKTATGTLTVNNPVPATTGINPASKNVGDAGFTLTVNGSNFVSTSVVRFNGLDRTTAYVNSSQLTATIPASDLTAAGSFPIAVFNPTPGGGTSNAQTLTVNPIITASAGLNGSISPSGAVAVDYNASQAFDITPDAGYHVDTLTVDGSPVTPAESYTFHNVIATHSISATFAIDTFTITTSAGAHGSITPANPAVDYNASQAFDITPATGYHVHTLTVDGSPVTPAESYTFHNVIATHSISATFLVGEAPNQPSNVSPPDRANVVSLSPTLQSSAFSDPDAGDTHAASQWQIRTSSGSYSTPVLGWTSNTDLTSFTVPTVPSGTLAYDTTYYWHVQYQDNNGNWSSYSDETSFRTYSLSQPNTPAGSGVTVVLNGVTITFADVSVAGNTTVTQEGSPCGSLPSDLIARGPSWHFTTTATYTGPVRVAIRYDDSSIPTEGDLRLLHCNGTSWKDVTTSVNTVNNIIYGEDSVLSWWQLGDPPEPGGGGGSGGGVPVFPNIYVGIGAALGAFILAYFISRRLVSARE